MDPIPRLAVRRLPVALQLRETVRADGGVAKADVCREDELREVRAAFGDLAFGSVGWGTLRRGGTC